MLDADPSKNAILLKNERVVSALEYEANKIIVAVSKVDLLIITDWKNIQVIKDPYPENVKTWLQLMPGFNVDMFPFIVCNGANAVNLVNVKDN